MVPVGPAAQDGTLPDVLLTRLRAALGAESATLWLPATKRHAQVLLSARADYTGLLDRPVPGLDRAFAGQRARILDYF